MGEFSVTLGTPWKIPVLINGSVDQLVETDSVESSRLGIKRRTKSCRERGVEAAGSE